MFYSVPLNRPFVDLLHLLTSPRLVLSAWSESFSCSPHPLRHRSTPDPPSAISLASPSFSCPNSAAPPLSKCHSAPVVVKNCQHGRLLVSYVVLPLDEEGDSHPHPRSGRYIHVLALSIQLLARFILTRAPISRITPEKQPFYTDSRCV